MGLPTGEYCEKCPSSRFFCEVWRFGILVSFLGASVQGEKFTNLTLGCRFAG